MLETDAYPVSLGVCRAQWGYAVPSWGDVYQLGTVVEIGRLRTPLHNVFLSVVVQIVGSEVHLVAEKIPGSVDSSHPGGRDAVAVAPAAAAAAHAASSH